MKAYLEIILLATIPVVLLILNFVPLNLRGGMLIVILFLVFFMAFKDKMSLKDLGLRTDNLRKSLLTYFLFTVVGVIGLVVLSILLDKKPIENWWTYSHLQWAFIPISLAQEFVYRSFAQTKLQKLGKPFMAILTITFLYSGMHILWRDPLVITMTFVGGLGWGYLWYKYPNFYLISISHAILNFLAIYLGFFPWLVTSYFYSK